MARYEFADGRQYISYEGGATFIRRCENCMRFVKPDKTIRESQVYGLVDEPNATCAKCGRTKMIFLGYY